MTKGAFGLYKEDLHQILIKIYESGLMNRQNATISFPNFRTAIANLEREYLFVRSHGAEKIQEILEENHYLKPFYSGAKVLQFNEKNFFKVIQDDIRTKKALRAQTQNAVPQLEVTFEHVDTSTNRQPENPDRSDTTPGLTHLLHCPICSSSFAKVEYFQSHLENQHKTYLNCSNRKGWSGGSSNFFQLNLVMDADLNLTLTLTHVVPCRTTLKNMLIGEPRKLFQRIEHGVNEVFDYGTVASVPFPTSLLDNTCTKYKIIIYAIDHSGAMIEEHQWMNFSSPFPELVHEIRQSAWLQMRDNERETRKKQKRLPNHDSNPELRSYFAVDFNSNWELIKPKKLDIPLPEDHKRLLELDNNRKVTEKDYVKCMKLLNSVEDVYTLYKVDEARFEHRVVFSEPSGRYMTPVNLFDLGKLSGVIGENDFIILQQIGKNREASGIIEGFEGGFLYFVLPPYDQISTKPFYNIFFEKNRTPIRMQQEALSNLPIETIEDYIFPTSCDEITENYQVLNWFNSSFEGNTEQRQAVTHILNRSSFPAPYILFGPPGTGKTTTLVEAIYQIWKFKPQDRILVTTPSNFACDEIAKRLLKMIPSTDMFRYYAKSIEKRREFIDPEILMCSNLSDGVHEQPSETLLRTYRIILSTLTNTGRMPLNNFKKDFFSYIFIDECGSAKEPETLIPIVGLISETNVNETVLVLAGDPKQLGPVVSFRFAENCGLGLSFLERLMQMDLYKPKPYYNRNVITKLLQNYRSHQAILDVPNALFYDKELIACGAKADVEWACGWKELPNKKLPIIFHNVTGFSYADSDSPSFYNTTEVDIVMSYVDKLMNGIFNKGRRVQPKEIGVVTPYTKQANRIRDKLKGKNLCDVSVGTVEAFQGQEREVIIISTVRSDQRTIGFLKNPKRMNVAITRAKALLIIVGCAMALKTDKHWRELLQYYLRNGAVVGEIFNMSIDLPRVESNNENGASVDQYLINNIQALTIE